MVNYDVKINYMIMKLWCIQACIHAPTKNLMVRDISKNMKGACLYLRESIMGRSTVLL